MAAGIDIELDDRLRRLQQGRDFEQIVRREWQQTSEVWPTPRTTRRHQRRGFIDLFVAYDDPTNGPGREPMSATILEVKNTDWDPVKFAGIRRYCRRTAVQLWDYQKAEVPEHLGTAQLVVVFRRPPRKPEVTHYIEMLFALWAITVIWFETNQATPYSMFRYDEPAYGDPRDPVVYDPGHRDWTIDMAAARAEARAVLRT
jgi:hypothetical protein